MPPKKAAPSWKGAPPVSGDGFAFANGDFFADASGQNQHRRATAAEINEHFRSGNEKEHPAHWFEAQLAHYGLDKSKAKSVARMRLHDAAKEGKLIVPSRITKLEATLKKEWMKNDREAKKALKSASVIETKVAGVKRKAETNVSVTVNLTVSGSDSPKPPAKKAKAATPKAKAAPKTVPKEKAKSAAKPATPKAKATPKAASTTATKAKAKPAAKAAKTATPKAEVAPKIASRAARRGTLSQGPGRGTSATIQSQAPAPQARQVARARRGGASVTRGRISAQNAQPMYNDGYDSYGDDNHGPYDESPPPHSEYDEDSDTYGNVSIAPLGLINGSYDVTSSSVTSQWSHFGSDFGLELRIAGTQLWGGFDLGLFEGVMRFEERPRRSSRDTVPFTWRGREDQGPIIYGNYNHGWIKFLGGGRIEGWLDRQNISFRGRHIQGQGTGGGTTAHSFQDQWNGYSEEECERENRAHW
ncbi:hypothetical protein G7Z17_g9352 [Cylindrodendrum hubeiense]|uniref:Uncharacterized protein n=1 Tax=Cylindrodendrum hubeiense TaxID=595255 RepID=A0A9P5H817_9HYPO|nr:hypothetical protein G7Z17_g9352 [Cylindrodendrum hubeiense]